MDRNLAAMMVSIPHDTVVCAHGEHHHGPEHEGGADSKRTVHCEKEGGGGEDVEVGDDFQACISLQEFAKIAREKRPDDIFAQADHADIPGAFASELRRVMEMVAIKKSGILNNIRMIFIM